MYCLYIVFEKLVDTNYEMDYFSYILAVSFIGGGNQ
jgi:hypothetical protein